MENKNNGTLAILAALRACNNSSSFNTTGFDCPDRSVTFSDYPGNFPDYLVNFPVYHDYFYTEEFYKKNKGSRNSGNLLKQNPSQRKSSNRSDSSTKKGSAKGSKFLRFTDSVSFQAIGTDSSKDIQNSSVNKEATAKVVESLVSGDTQNYHLNMVSEVSDIKKFEENLIKNTGFYFNCKAECKNECTNNEGFCVNKDGTIDSISLANTTNNLEVSISLKNIPDIINSKDPNIKSLATFVYNNKKLFIDILNKNINDFYPPDIPEHSDEELTESNHVAESGREENPSQETDLNQEENSGREENSNQETDLNQEEDSNRVENSNQETDLNQEENSNRVENSNREENPDQETGSGHDKDSDQEGNPDQEADLTQGLGSNHDKDSGQEEDLTQGVGSNHDTDSDQEVVSNNNAEEGKVKSRNKKVAYISTGILNFSIVAAVFAAISNCLKRRIKDQNDQVDTEFEGKDREIHGETYEETFANLSNSLEELENSSKNPRNSIPYFEIIDENFFNLNIEEDGFLKHFSYKDDEIYKILLNNINKGVSPSYKEDLIEPLASKSEIVNDVYNNLYNPYNTTKVDANVVNNYFSKEEIGTVGHICNCCFYTENKNIRKETCSNLNKIVKESIFDKINNSKDKAETLKEEIQETINKIIFIQGSKISNSICNRVKNMDIFINKNIGEEFNIIAIPSAFLRFELLKLLALLHIEKNLEKSRESGVERSISMC